MGEERETLILPESDRPLIRLALASSGQWRMAGIGLGATKPVSLDLTAVDTAARWLGITPSARLLDGLAILEREALKLMRTAQ